MRANEWPCMRARACCERRALQPFSPLVCEHLCRCPRHRFQSLVWGLSRSSLRTCVDACAREANQTIGSQRKPAARDTLYEAFSFFCRCSSQSLPMAVGPVAQWIRHRPTEPGIAGSSPAGVMFVWPGHSSHHCCLFLTVPCVCVAICLFRAAGIAPLKKLIMTTTETR